MFFNSSALKEILLKIGFIEEMRTTWGNEAVSQTFFHNSPYSRKYDFIGLTPYHWQPCILQFCDITTSQKTYCWSVLIGSLGLLATNFHVWLGYYSLIPVGKLRVKPINSSVLLRYFPITDLRLANSTEHSVILLFIVQ